MPASGREYYSESDFKDVSKESSLDSIKFEADGKDEQEKFEKRTMWALSYLLDNL